MIHGRLLKSSSINNMYYCKENERRVSSNSNSIINLNYSTTNYSKKGSVEINSVVVCSK